jgi:hypothetical protein
MPRSRWLIVLLALVLLAPATAQDTTPLALERAIHRAFDDGEHDRAVKLSLELLGIRPNDPLTLYNLACAYCYTGDLDEANSALFRAVEAGFGDFDFMQRDPDLEPIRDGQMYRAILEASRRIAGKRAESALERWKDQYGTEGYRYEIDESRHLAFATALDGTSHEAMREMLQLEADHLRRTFFGDPPEYYVLVAIPKPRDADAIFGGDDSIGGKYEHGLHRLVSRDIGGSLRHEFVHAMHYGHMERLGLREPHPLWLQEGLAALYEDYEMRDDGSVKFLPNERSNVVRRNARGNRLTRWSVLFTMTPDEFMRRPGKTYPEARAIFEYLAERSVLGAWYRAYIDNYADDTTGIVAFETVFEKPIDEIESAWRSWARNRAPVDHQIRWGDASLGVESGLNSGNDGVLIDRVRPGSAAARAGIRRGDVIVAVDDRDTRSLIELQKVIGAKDVGDRVMVRLRRRGRYLTKEVELRPLQR